MVRRRKATRDEVWPLWLREFRADEWPGGDDVERAWAWREAGYSFARDHPSECLAVFQRLRAVRDTLRVRNDSGLPFEEWRERQRIE